MNKDQIIGQCRQIARDPLAFVTREKRSKGYQYIGSACIFIPEELLHAAGFVPIPILGYSQGLRSVEKYLPSNCCEFARNVFETLNSGAMDFCDLLLFSHCCDTLEIIGDITPSVVTGKVYQFNTPTNFNSSDALSFLNKQVIRLKNYLEEHFDRRISEQALRHSWETFTKNYELSKKLHDLRRKKPGILSGYDSTAVMLAGRFLPKEEHNDMLEGLLKELENQDYTERDGKKIILSGSTNGNIELINLIETSGGIIVDDDLCETSRGIPLNCDQPLDFPVSHSRRIFERFCPVKINDASLYSDLVIDRFRKAKADGVIFTFFPACDAQFIEYAYVKNRLGQENIRLLTLEIVVGNRNFGQMQTRIEAFLESIQSLSENSAEAIPTPPSD